MATYTELFNLVGSATTDDLKRKIVVALIIKANTLSKLPTPTALQKEFAKATLAKPETYLYSILHYILADNNTATTTQITSASDTLVQNAVNAAVDTLFGV